MKRGLVLFAHGAREAHWAQPFERLLHRVRSLRPGVEARLAFLEIMKPDLAEAVDELVSLGCVSLTVVPVFLGEGGHVRHDLPLLVDQLRMSHPHVDIASVLAVGEDSDVLEAVAAYCVRGVDPGRPSLDNFT